MASSNHPLHVGIASCCVALLATSCVKMTPLSLASPGDDAFSGGLGQKSGGSSLIANNSGSLQGAALSGQLQIPHPSLISNNSGSLISDAGASLTNVGGGAFYGSPRQILALTTNPLANALVSLVDANGAPVGSTSVQTDSQGHYAFSQIPPIDGPLFVQANFSANGKDFSFKTLLPTLSATATAADIDVASTLVAEKSRVLLQQKLLDPKELSLQKLQALIAAVRSTLIPELVPFMARNSGDVVPTLDQLTLDNSSIQQAASGIAPSVASPTETWHVSTLYRRTALQTLTSFNIQANGFEADKDGNLYFWDATSTPPNYPTKLWKVTPAGAASVVAPLPIMPASIADAPDGSLYIVGLHSPTGKFVVCHVVGSSVSILPGYLGQVPQGPLTGVPTFAEAPYGRVAIDDAGNVYAAYKREHVIVRLASGSATPEIFAGSFSQPGYRDGQGTGAQFTAPMSPVRGPDGAIYVADSGNGCIRRIALDGTVTTYAGKPNDGTYRNGRGAYARFGTPNTLVVDAHGDCLISDGQSRRIRRISPDGSAFLLAGTGAAGSADGLAPDATFNSPKYLALDGQGKVYVLDQDEASPSVPLLRVISKQ